jgi:hypothetical protein
VEFATILSFGWSLRMDSTGSPVIGMANSSAFTAFVFARLGRGMTYSCQGKAQTIQRGGRL